MDLTEAEGEPCCWGRGWGWGRGRVIMDTRDGEGEQFQCTAAWGGKELHLNVCFLKSYMRGV